MATKQGSVALLNDPVAQELLRIPPPPRASHMSGVTALRGLSPFGSAGLAKRSCLAHPPRPRRSGRSRLGAKVALSIDSNTWPYKVLQIRGTAGVRRPSRAWFRNTHSQRSGTSVQTKGGRESSRSRVCSLHRFALP